MTSGNHKKLENDCSWSRSMSAASREVETRVGNSVLCKPGLPNQIRKTLADELSEVQL
jgi:hypothetical protein